MAYDWMQSHCWLTPLRLHRGGPTGGRVAVMEEWACRQLAMGLHAHARAASALQSLGVCMRPGVTPQLGLFAAHTTPQHPDASACYVTHNGLAPCFKARAPSPQRKHAHAHTLRLCQRPRAADPPCPAPHPAPSQPASLCSALPPPPPPRRTHRPGRTDAERLHDMQGQRSTAQRGRVRGMQGRAVGLTGKGV